MNKTTKLTALIAALGLGAAQGALVTEFYWGGYGCHFDRTVTGRIPIPSEIPLMQVISGTVGIRERISMKTPG